MPYEHYSDKKRNLTSFVEIFDIPSLSWSRVPTVGIPPAAMMNYSCASISDTAYYLVAIVILVTVTITMCLPSVLLVTDGMRSYIPTLKTLL